MKHAGIVRYGGVGDNLIVASVLRPMKTAGYHVEVISQKPNGLVFENNPYIDKLSLKEPKDFPFRSIDWPAWYLKQTREYDLFLNLNLSVEMSMNFPAAMPQFYWPVEWRRKTCNQNYLEFVHDIAGVPHSFGPLFFPTKNEQIEALAHRTRLGRELVIGWVITGSRIDTVYPHAVEVISRLMTDLGAAVVMLGAPPPTNDWNIAQQIAAQILGRGGSLDSYCIANPDGWNVRSLIAFAQRCDLMIGPDTGPMWGVALEDVPKIMLLSGVTGNMITKHWRNTVTLGANQDRVPCWPCHRLQHSFETCTPNASNSGAACISDITPDAILNAASELGIKVKKGSATWAAP